MRIFSCLLFLTLLFFCSSLTAKILKKKVILHQPFKITIPSEYGGEIYIVSKVDESIVSNLEPIITDSEKTFVFLPYSLGETEIYIDKITPEAFQKDFFKYSVEVVLGNKTDAIKKEILRRKSVKKKEVDESVQLFELIQGLYQNTLYERALKHIERYLSDFPAGKHKHKVYAIHSEIHLSKNQPDEILATLRPLFTQAKSSKDKIQLALLLTEAYNHQKKYKQTIETLLEAKGYQEDKASNDHFNYELGKALFTEKKYASAQKELRTILNKHLNKDKVDQFPQLDDVIFKLARIHELDPKLRDMQKAFALYGEMIEQCPESALLEKAKQRKKYLSRHFLNPK